MSPTPPVPPSRVSEAPVRLGHQPALDGLRAIAVLAVMLHHSDVLPGGWLGVDVFFTLSGFLITTLLLEERERAGAVSLRHFYTRRALRLLPALGVLVLVCGVITIVWSPPHLFWNRVLYVVAVALYVANWALVWGLPLFAFGHTWSLAIEEQFYLAWPPALLVLLRAVRHRATACGLVVLAAAAALAWRIVLQAGGASTARLFVGLDTHADSLLLGCALAMAVSWCLVPAVPLAGRAAVVAGGAAVVALGVLFATARYPGAFLHHFATTLTAVATTVLIAALLEPSSAPARALGTRPLVAIGRISYGLYLWHFPIFLAVGVLAGRTAGLDPGRLLLAWVVTFAVCIASFRVIEAPALRLKARFRGAAPVAIPSRDGEPASTPLLGTESAGSAAPVAESAAAAAPAEPPAATREAATVV